MECSSSNGHFTRALSHKKRFKVWTNVNKRDHRRHSRHKYKIQQHQSCVYARSVKNITDGLKDGWCEKHGTVEFTPWTVVLSSTGSVSWIMGLQRALVESQSHEWLSSNQTAASDWTDSKEPDRSFETTKSGYSNKNKHETKIRRRRWRTLCADSGPPQAGGGS